MRVAIYARVSTSDQNTQLQINELKAFSKARGWVSVAVYEDHGYSGGTSKRPQLQKLLKDARARKIDVILSWKLDRLFRSLRHLVDTLHLLNDLGIQFISLKDQIDMTTSSGRLMVHLLASFAEFERDLCRERVRAGLRAAKANGKRLGRPRLVDYAKIKRLRDRGHSYSSIQKKLGISKGAVCRAVGGDANR